ncbi:hypothetical protein UNDYM_4251 [Undibacterium sp. YM2]|uniref:hypothetical protein n=1 Tax=Undibacterium sp. YM2 TaxID=2058625 RepID=UPI001331D959|nr:hypothetical protein [Undibacterium sp. YM2]BBB68504.1 hypothetical protein UNDYM_4251 [Undibacterium sp. YM2]
MPKISKVNLAASVIGLTLLFTIVTASVFWTLAEEERLPMMIGANSIAFVFAIAAWNGVFEQKVRPMTWVGWLGLFFLGER